MKKVSLVAVLILTVLVFAGCSEEKMNELAKEYVVKEATMTAIQSIKTVEKKDVVFTSHEFNQEDGNHLVVLKGYEVNHPDIKREVMIDYNQDFEIVQQSKVWKTKLKQPE